MEKEAYEPKELRSRDGRLVMVKQGTRLIDGKKGPMREWSVRIDGRPARMWQFYAWRDRAQLIEAVNKAARQRSSDHTDVSDFAHMMVVA